MSVMSARSPTTMNDTNSRFITAVWLRIPFFWDVTLLHCGVSSQWRSIIP